MVDFSISVTASEQRRLSEFLDALRTPCEVWMNPKSIWRSGMETFTNDIMADLLSSSLETATVDASGWHDTGEGPGSAEGRYINWLTIANNAASVVEDVKRIKAHPLVPGDVPVYGYIYDCKSGKLVEVPEATAAGRTD